MTQSNLHVGRIEFLFSADDKNKATPSSVSEGDSIKPYPFENNSEICSANTWMTFDNLPQNHWANFNIFGSNEELIKLSIK